MSEQERDGFSEVLAAVRDEFEDEDDRDDIYMEIAFGRIAQTQLEVVEAERDALLGVIHDAKSSLLDAHARAAIKEVTRMTDPKIAALVDLGNAAYKAATIATPLEIDDTLRKALEEGGHTTERILVVRKDDGLWLHFGPDAAISLDSILDGRGPIVDRNVRDFCGRLEGV